LLNLASTQGGFRALGAAVDPTLICGLIRQSAANPKQRPRSVHLSNEAMAAENVIERI
jgi:hypothetical protein